MYERHYALRTRAFEPAPDPHFHLPSLTQRRAMGMVSQAFDRGQGIVVVTGAAGLGKSLLIARLIDQLAAQPVTVAAVTGGEGSLAAQAAAAFGLAQPDEEAHAMAALEAFLLEEARRGQRSLLLIDDAEGLANAAAGELAALAALHHGSRGLLQIVLAGDEDFARALAEEPAWAALREWTVASPALEPLLADELEPYLRHRLLCAGWAPGAPALDPGLSPLLFEATGGVPGAVNRAMTALLDQAAAAGQDCIGGEGLAAWIDADQPAGMEYAIIAPPASHDGEDVGGLAEAQIAAIEGAFAEHDRMLARLRRELAELRDASPAARPAEGAEGVDERLEAIEARLEQQEQALRHVLERLIAHFERTGPGGGR